MIDKKQVQLDLISLLLTDSEFHLEMKTEISRAFLREYEEHMKRIQPSASVMEIIKAISGRAADYYLTQLVNKP